jgi:hypothetical protein
VVVANVRRLIMTEEQECSPSKDNPGCTTGTLTGLAELPAKTLLTETALAVLLRVSPRTVRRMVARFELPPPVRMAGKPTWLVERVLAHIEARAARAARQAELEAQRLAALGAGN